MRRQIPRHPRHKNPEEFHYNLPGFRGLEIVEFNKTRWALRDPITKKYWRLESDNLKLMDKADPEFYYHCTTSPVTALDYYIKAVLVILNEPTKVTSLDLEGKEITAEVIADAVREAEDEEVEERALQSHKARSHDRLFQEMMQEDSR